MGAEEPVGERIAKLEQWRDGHEERCEASLKGIGRSIDQVRGRVDKLIYALVMFLIAITGWMAVQLYVLQPLRVSVTATQPAAVSVAEKP